LICAAARGSIAARVAQGARAGTVHLAAGAATKGEEKVGLDMLPPFAQTLGSPGSRGVAGPSLIVANPIMDWVWYAQPHFFFARRTDSES